MTPNKGRQPIETKGKRIRVKLANGMTGKGDWAADTSRWSLTKHPFDIANYEVCE